MDNKEEGTYNKKNKNRNDNISCWILDNTIKDVLPYFFINLKLNDIKNLRLVCRKFQSVIDNNCDKLYNLIFRLKIYDKMKTQELEEEIIKNDALHPILFCYKTEKQKQELEEIIKKHPILKSFLFFGLFDDDGRDLIRCIPDYTTDLVLESCYHLDNQLESKFLLSLESLYLRDCNLTLKFWNSIPSSLSSLSLYSRHDWLVDKILIEKFPSNLKNLIICTMDLTNLKIWPQNLVHLELSVLSISSDKILKLSKVSTLSFLDLYEIEGIIEIDLSNFNSLKSLTYRPGDDNQYIYFPSSLHILILHECSNKNLESTKLPKSLIRLEIFDSYSDLNLFLTELPKTLIHLEIRDPYLCLDLFLLKKEIKFPFLKVFIDGKQQK